MHRIYEYIYKHTYIYVWCLDISKKSLSNIDITREDSLKIGNKRRWTRFIWLLTEIFSEACEHGNKLTRSQINYLLLVVAPFLVSYS
jgi:hypothetical protein